MSVTPQELPIADQINEAMAALAGCVFDGLDPVCAATIILGDTDDGQDDFQPDDEDADCDDDCSRAWVRVNGAYPANGIGVANDEPNQSCETLIGMDLEIGIIRCVEIEKNGEAPTATNLLAASIQNIRDMVAIRKAVLCCTHFEDYQLGDWTPTGPDGGRVGGYWTLAVLV